MILSDKIAQFAIRIGEGTAKLSSDISLTSQQKGQSVMLIGCSPVNTAIDLQGHYIHIVGIHEDAHFCFQDLSLTNGKVPETQG